MKSILRVLLFSIIIHSINLAQSERYLNLTLQECINIALENSKQLKIAGAQIEKSNALLRQAESVKMPQIDLLSRAYIHDEAITYLQPPINVNLPPVDFLGAKVTVPQFDVQAQKFTLEKNGSLITDINLLYPLYTGGKISSIVNQAELGVKIVESDKSLAERELINKIKDTFTAFLITERVKKIINESVQRMQVTFDVLENLIQSNSLKASKLDYLKAKVAIALLKEMQINILNQNKALSAGLKYFMGVKQNSEVTIVSDYPVINNDELKNFLKEEKIVENNPLINKIESAINIYGHKITEAKSDYYPSAGLFLNYSRWDNANKYSYFTEENKNLFTVGFGLKWTLFNGFRTSAKVEEETAELSKYTFMKKQINEGLEFERTKLLTDISDVVERINVLEEALKAATESRELNLKAYQLEVNPLKDYLEAQYYETMLGIQYETALYSKAKLLYKAEELFGK